MPQRPHTSPIPSTQNSPRQQIAKNSLTEVELADFGPLSKPYLQFVGECAKRVSKIITHADESSSDLQDIALSLPFPPPAQRHKVESLSLIFKKNSRNCIYNLNGKRNKFNRKFIQIFLSVMKFFFIVFMPFYLFIYEMPN